MELLPNQNKNIEITVSNQTYLRGAIKTHFVAVGEDYIKLVEDYVKPHYQEGDILSIGEKVVALCQKRIVTKEDVKPTKLALFLSRFASQTTAGQGVYNPYKMQFAIMLNGKLKVIYAAVAGGICKIFGKKGVFYEIVGPEVTGLDGFYGECFDEYKEFGIRIPENPDAVCNEIYEKLGIKTIIVDANDFAVNLLGKSDAIELSKEDLIAIMKDNPSGQSDECTPFVIVRKKGE